MSRAARYEVRIKASAERDMNRLSANVADRIAKAILSLETSPRPRGVQETSGARAVSFAGWKLPNTLYR